MGMVTEAPFSDTETARRLHEEVLRAQRYKRALSVLVLTPGADETGFPDVVLGAVAAAMRAVDILGRLPGAGALLILPETGDSADVPGERAMSIVRPSMPGARGGLATLPYDAGSAEELLGRCHTAAAAARPGTLRRALDEHTIAAGSEAFVACDSRMREPVERMRRLAAGELPVLFTGETGSGKDVLARALHAFSRRAGGPFVPVNCAALSDSLLEAELFGHERGAFTGAVASRGGLIEAASGGTLFLDEIGEAPQRLQAELLRVLETGKLRRVGETEERAVDVRIVAATNRDLKAVSEAGRFRSDLYYRLAGAVVDVPPLRRRPHDLVPLARTILRRAAARRERGAPYLSEEALTVLQAHSWPGNVRELRNALEYAIEVGRDDCVSVADLLDSTRSISTTVAAPRDAAGFRNIGEEVAELESRRMREALEVTGGVRVRAAALIGMPLRTFVTKLKVYGLSGPKREAKAADVGPATA
jgi:two-component system response regulator AtoC